MSTYTIPDNLFPYQKDDVNRLLRSDYSICNFSEMGTGKTPVSIAFSRLGKFKRTLIACPKTLRLEWARQIKEWTDIDPVVSRRGCYSRLDPLMEDLAKKETNPFFIVNYETFRTPRHMEVLNQVDFDLVIMDEAHRLRNHSRKMFKGIREFLDNQPKAKSLPLTGSPIVNSPGDLHTMLRLVRPETYHARNRQFFLDRYCVFSERGFLRCRDCGAYDYRLGSPVCQRCGSTNLKITVTQKPTGVRNLEELREETEPFTIRRTKKECLPWLPDKCFRTVVLDMPKEQRKIYKQMEEELFVMLDSGEPLWASSVLAQLTRLRQINLDPKIVGAEAPSAKVEFLEDLLESSDEKFVVYSTSEILIRRLASTLPYKCITISGKTDADSRVPLSVEFNKDPSIKVCLATIGPESPGGEGLTLTGASNCVFLDRWWTPITQSQAEDRLHRIGQKDSVQVIVPVNSRSIDQSLDRILHRKRAFSLEYFGEGDEQDIVKEVIDDLRASRKLEKDEEDEKEDEDENGD